MMIYNQGKQSNGPFRLSGFPSAAQVLKQGLTSSIFSLGSTCR